MIDKDSLLILQREAFSRSPWHSLLSALNGVSSEAFFRVPQRHNGFDWMNGSIRDIVYHVTGDKLVQHSAAFANGAETWETLKSKLEQENHELMIEQLKSAQHVLEKELNSTSVDSLSSQVSTWGGKKMRMDKLFLMLIEHDYYHAGQIRYVRNVLE